MASGSGHSTPPRCFFMYLKNATLKAFSLEHAPHAIVTTLLTPTGATRDKLLPIISLKSTDGKKPRAGRLIIVHCVKYNCILYQMI